MTRMTISVHMAKVQLSTFETVISRATDTGELGYKALSLSHSSPLHLTQLRFNHCDDNVVEDEGGQLAVSWRQWR